MDSVALLSPNAEWCVQRAEQAQFRHQDQNQNNHNGYIEQIFDRGGHWNVGVNQIHYDADNDEKNDQS